ncbi:MAG: OmpA family protein [Acidobacteriota bacterium]|nr:OmpA family protein [Acidobacteriota bacterium]
MRKRISRLPVVVVAVALVASTGCVSKKVFRKNVEDTDAKVTAVESAVEANERRISDLSDETDSRIAAVDKKAEEAVEIGSQAMSRASTAQTTAEEAARAARGTLLWTVVLSDEDVRFSFDQATLPETATSTLDELVARAKGLDRGVYFEVEGHTDNTGSEEYNQRLGLMRAESVRAYLHDSGDVPLHAISTISFGESMPIADNSTAQGRAANRRVVVRVLEQ